MKIFCSTCKEYILKTSDLFRCGGPYDGSMFEPATPDKWSATMFPMREDITKGDLHCPRCMGAFIGLDGSIITEHGRVKTGVERIDESFSIMRDDGDILAHVQDAKELEHFPEDPAEDVVTTVEPSVDEKPELPDADIIDESELDETAETETDDGDILESQEPDEFVCQKCGKIYTSEKWYVKHMETCGSE